MLYTSVQVTKGIKFSGVSHALPLLWHFGNTDLRGSKNLSASDLHPQQSKLYLRPSNLPFIRTSLDRNPHCAFFVFLNRVE